MQFFILCNYSIVGTLEIRNESSFGINDDNWRYKLFKTEGKYEFIIIAGAYNAVYAFVYILLLLFFKFLVIEHITLGDVLFLIAVLVVIPLLAGYIDYKKYKSVKLE
jgi:hypothetical protein